MRALLRVGALAFVLCTLGCIGATPDDDARAALGPDRRRPGPLHRAGQPCLLCHSERGGDHPYMVVGGTIYAPDGVTGRDSISVTLIDARGSDFTVQTNAVGNFSVGLDDWRPAFPLTVAVTDGDDMREMRSPISIEGSCAFCHAETTSTTSAGPVIVGAMP